jgi:hypothetical protein
MKKQAISNFKNRIIQRFVPQFNPTKDDPILLVIGKKKKRKERIKLTEKMNNE